MQYNDKAKIIVTGSVKFNKIVNLDTSVLDVKEYIKTLPEGKLSESIVLKHRGSVINEDAIFKKYKSPIYLFCKIDKKEEELILCKNNCGFYGNSKQNNLCSKCFQMENTDNTKKTMENKIENTIENTVENTMENTMENTIEITYPAKGGSLKCFTCSKKLVMFGYKCKCGNDYCITHRHSFNHNCTETHKEKLNELRSTLFNQECRPERIKKI